MPQCLSSCHRHLLSSQRSAASCLLMPPPQFASCLPVGCQVAPVVLLLPPLVLLTLLFASWLSCCISSCHLHLTSPFDALPPHMSIHDPSLHLQRLVFALHLVTLPLPPVLYSTPLPLNALLPHIMPATPPPTCLLFSPTGCCIASCLAGYPIASPKAATSHLLVTLPLIAPSPLVMPLSMPLPLVPLVRLDVVLSLLTLPHPICRHLCLSLWAVK